MYPVIKAKDHKKSWIEKSAQALHDHNEEVKTCPWSKLKETVERHGFIVKCPGIRNVINTGYIVTCPFDIIIETFGDGRKFDALSLGPKQLNHKVGIHPKGQLHDFIPMPEGTLLDVPKISTGWHIVPHPDYVFLVTNPLYTGETRFTCSTGILDPYDDTQCNALLFWHVLKGRTIIKGGTPLIQYIPIPRSFVQPELVVRYATEKDEENFKRSQAIVKLATNRNHIKVKEANRKIYDGDR
jgi:hypothetical protein